MDDYKLDIFIDEMMHLFLQTEANILLTLGGAKMGMFVQLMLKKWKFVIGVKGFTQALQLHHWISAPVKGKLLVDKLNYNYKFEACIFLSSRMCRYWCFLLSIALLLVPLRNTTLCLSFHIRFPFAAFQVFIYIPPLSHMYSFGNRAYKIYNQAY